MRLIFLDIDGVLNSTMWYKNRLSRGGEETEFDPQAVALLNDIVKETGAKIVLSSTWRISRTIEHMRDLFIRVGLKVELIDFTPDLKTLRGLEIYEWMKANRDLLGTKQHLYKNYAIIDDSSDMLYWHRKNFFQTDGYVGLTPTVAYYIKNHFDD